MRALTLALTFCAFGCSGTRPRPPLLAPDGPAPAVDGDGNPVDEDAPPATPWAVRRAKPTRLLARGPAPAIPAELHLDPTMEMVRIDGRLAVLARPPSLPSTADTPAERLPGVVLFHGGFALTDEHLAWARPFVDAGFVVMLPTLRGENGNPGAYELWRGEVDDAKSAIRFFASEPDVDVDRLYAFGHSAGGGIAGLLALDDVPFRILATSNGVYAAGTFLRWPKERVPFDTADLDERTVRALVPNAHEIQRRLIIYAGRQDEWTMKHAQLVKARAPTHVDVVELDGDHMGSLPAAVERFHSLVTADAYPASRPLARR